ncbi:hypothetical protein LUZ61_007502 [Rhynchospora tenuis]|uniref:Polygalacturonase n=1 Tax=Rhynchospora tenuis TaxID=198213 RepID=A0AAD6EWI1_9POAL|nr:hypothetical protein LUZ61_007502 [Rhynchospora tenuis]
MKRSTAFCQALLFLATIFLNSMRAHASVSYCKPMDPTKYRPHSVTITEFGAVGDGVTLNTKAFENAIFYLNSFADKGGAELFVPAGKWLTGSFNLINHLTLSLDKDAVIIGSMDSNRWPVIDPLPSYGRGRELPGGRHKALIFGSNLTDVIITGANGTIDGQGAIWWEQFKNHTLDYTRPHLVELMYSTEVVISNLTFVNSPFWAIHPVYSSQVLIQNVTILAPLDSPNTDAIDPDSSTNVCIEDCYISTGDDIIVIKSGWDEYGISFARPSSNISIRHITGQSGSGAGIAIGSEMSGGVSEVHAENLHFTNSLHGIRVKTSAGRGGYIRNLHISDVTMNNVSIAIRIAGQYGEHPDDKYDQNALPVISRITIKDVVGFNIGTAGMLEGIQGDNFSNICLSNISFGSVRSNPPWKCSNIEGYSNMVTPELCNALNQVPSQATDCYDDDILEQQPHRSCASRSRSHFLKLSSIQ